MRRVGETLLDSHCASCGAELSKDGPYCIACGHKVVNAVDPPDPSTIPDSELFDAKWRASVQVNTSRFYNHLNLLPISKPQDREHGYLNDPMFQGNGIQPRLILIVGGQSSGKDAKLVTIRQKVEQVYDGRNVGYQEAKGEAFRDILGAEKWPNRIIQVLSLNDVTDVSFKDDDLRDFFRIREVMQTKTGRSRGLVLLMIAGHTFYKIPTEFRAHLDMILLSDLPTSPKGTFHREIYESWVPDKLDQERLRRIRLKRIGDPRWCGYAYMIDHGEPAGFIYLPQVEARKERTLHLPSLHLPSLHLHLPHLPHLRREQKQAPQTLSKAPMGWLLKFAIIMFIITVLLFTAAHFLP